MSNQKTQEVSDLLAAKRAAVLETRGKKRKFLLPVAGLLVVVGLVGFFGLRMMPEKEVKTAEGAMFGFVPTSGEVSYPLDDFSEASIHFYQHKADDGVLVRYFVHVGADQTVTAALDACADCWRAGKGHHQEGGELACMNCDKRFELGSLDEVVDPCKPIQLTSTVRDDRVIIQVPELLEGAKYFKKPQFRKGV